MKMTIARNERVSALTLDRLAQEPDIHIRMEVAKNPNASANTLKRLAKDSLSSIRGIARQHPRFKALGFLDRWFS
jgi:hypothetical protein